MFQIEDGRLVFYQWDLNRRVIVEDPKVTQVHFCNAAKEQTLTSEVYFDKGYRVADVPNILLQETRPIKAYAHDGSYTMHGEIYSVIPRAKPTEYIYTETEVKNWDEISSKIEYLDELIKHLEFNQGAQGPQGEPGPQGEKGDKGEPGVNGNGIKSIRIEEVT